MYATCTFCFRPLGRNETIEPFPVGRRLAFDPERGRLWVVCRSCDRWNLTPFDERWEAVEECERRFRATRLRVSTDNIGLARLPDGLDLVRIGRPQRPELAAWRYGPRLHRRRLRAAALLGGATATGGLVLAAGAAAGALAAVAWLATGYGWMLWQQIEKRYTVLRLPHRGRPFYDLSLDDMSRAQIVSAGPAPSWQLVVAHQSGDLTLGGDEARRALSLMLVRMNWAGASADHVRDAVWWLDRYDGAHGLLASTSRAAPRLADLIPERRLAIEMALHEDDERRAMEGELAALEATWREAERIAAIADNLLLPQRVESMLASLRASRPGERFLP